MAGVHFNILFNVQSFDVVAEQPEAQGVTGKGLTKK